MKLGRLEVKASRWPWMPLEQHWSHGSDAPARYGWGTVPGMGRFGGGWQYKLGVTAGGRTVMLDLLFGSIRIVWARPS